MNSPIMGGIGGWIVFGNNYTAANIALSLLVGVIAAPVEVGRASLAATGGRVRAVIVNSGNANCATGRAGIVHQFPTLRVLPLTWRWSLYAALIAIGGAMLGALYPAFKAAQKDPIDALAYE